MDNRVQPRPKIPIRPVGHMNSVLRQTWTRYEHTVNLAAQRQSTFANFLRNLVQKVWFVICATIDEHSPLFTNLF